MRRLALALLPLALAACPADPDPGSPDAAPGAPDAAPGAPDAAPVPLAGFGAISGDCGVLGESELTASSSLLFRNTLDFGTDPYDEADLSRLSTGGQEIINDGNAGGSSLLSEAFAYEVLYRCELAELLKTENEIAYTNTAGKKTDELVQIDGHKLGVSVTRAFVYPPTDPYTVERATQLLTDKLGDIQLSSANVSAEDAWEKQILSVVAYAPGHADAIETAYAALAGSVTADTILVVTVTEGDDDPLY